IARGDRERRRKRSRGRKVDEERADKNGRPQLDPPQYQRRERDAGRRPDGRRACMEESHRQAEFPRDHINRDEKDEADVQWRAPRNHEPRCHYAQIKSKGPNGVPSSASLRSKVNMHLTPRSRSGKIRGVNSVKSSVLALSLLFMAAPFPRPPARTHTPAARRP